MYDDDDDDDESFGREVNILIFVESGDVVASSLATMSAFRHFQVSVHVSRGPARNILDYQFLYVLDKLVFRIGI